MALAVMGEIADEIATRFGVTRLAIVHRDGDVPLGEPSVAIVACAPHRDAAFEAARYAIDETKARAPIWKAEQFSDGHVWIGDPARSGPVRGLTHPVEDPGMGTPPGGSVARRRFGECDGPADRAGRVQPMSAAVSRSGTSTAAGSSVRLAVAPSTSSR